jgi:flagellar secretion chaperone FliS
MQAHSTESRIMFATATSPRSTQAFTNAYRQVSVQTGVDNASAHRLILMLFEGLQDVLAQARGALAAGEIDAKGRFIGRAVRIVEEGLRASLNLKDGGEIASNLNALYSYITVRLTKANVANDVAALEECARLIEPVHSAWVAIGATQTRAAQ